MKKDICKVCGREYRVDRPYVLHWFANPWHIFRDDRLSAPFRQSKK